MEEKDRKDLKVLGEPVPQNEEKTRVTVKIYGEEYTLKGYADPKYIEGIASHVDKKMRIIGHKNPHLSLSKVAVLAALHIAEDLYKLQEDYNALSKQLDELKNLQ